MPEISTWHCTDNYLVGVLTSEDCVVTGYSNATTSASTSTPLYVQDSGNLSLGIVIIIFFLAIMTMGVITSAFISK